MKSNFLIAIKLTLVCMVLFVGVYTAVVLGIAQLVPNKGEGDVVHYNGKKYYRNIGQSFTSDAYFNSRPSAVQYNAAGAGGSNKGPSNPAYLQAIQQRIDTFLQHNPTVQRSQIPADIVTASGSGLDPHISVQAANIQIERIAAIRKIAVPNLQQLVITATEKPLFGLLGTEKVNVLQLNIALDQLK